MEESPWLLTTQLDISLQNPLTKTYQVDPTQLQGRRGKVRADRIPGEYFLCHTGIRVLCFAKCPQTLLPAEHGHLFAIYHLPPLLSLITLPGLKGAVSSWRASGSIRIPQLPFQGSPEPHGGVSPQVLRQDLHLLTKRRLTVPRGQTCHPHLSISISAGTWQQVKGLFE